MQIHTVFSIDDSPYMRWQADLLAYSHKKVNQPGPLTRLYSGWRIPPPFDGQTFHTIPYCPHPISGDHYPPYNRIMALLKWLRQSPPTEETILLLDPDCIFVTAYHSRSTVGRPVAQSIGYMCPTTARGAELLKRHGFKPESLQPIGIPILIHRDDLRVLLPRWQEHTEAIRDDPVSRDLASWTAEMWGYVFASSELGLRHELRELAHSQMDDRSDLPFIHYCYFSSNAQGQWEWTKRTYKPWASVTEPPNDTSQATVTLISLLNEFAKTHKNMLFNQ